MNPSTGKDLLQGKQAKQQLEYNAASRQLAINKAVLKGNLSEYDFLMGNPASGINIELERDYLMSQQRKDRHNLRDLTNSLIAELMGRDSKLLRAEVEQRLEGLSQGQQLAIKTALPSVEQTDLEAAIQNGLKGLLKKKTSTSVTKVELQKIIDDAIGKLSPPSTSITKAELQMIVDDTLGKVGAMSFSSGSSSSSGMSTGTSSSYMHHHHHHHQQLHHRH